MSVIFKSTRVVLLGAALSCGLAACGAADTTDESVTRADGSLAISGVTLQTVLVSRFVGAANNGGGAVNATVTVAQGWETFTFDDINGGSLTSGDSVHIRAGNGQYFQALNGGGSSLNAASNNTQAWETFKVVKQSGNGALKNGELTTPPVPGPERVNIPATLRLSAT